MREIRIRYHYEVEGWWADSPELPGFSAAGDTFMEVREMATQGVEFACDEPVLIVEEGLAATAQSDYSDTAHQFETHVQEMPIPA